MKAKFLSRLSRTVILSFIIAVVLTTSLGEAQIVKGEGASSAADVEALQGIAAPTAVATFHSVGLYWSPSGGSTSNTNHVRYRIRNSAQWKQGFPLWFDPRNSEYRGSLVNLKPGTAYEVELSLDSGASATLFATTWNENFPIVNTVYLPESSTGLTISQSGTESGYILYTHKPGKSAVLENCGTECISVQSGVHHVIIRELTLRSGKYGIRLNGAHDIVIEGNDISNWGGGSDYDAAIYSNSTSLSRVIVQGNKIHDPNFGSNSWDSGHPSGPQAITFFNSAGNHVIRYNDVYSVEGRYFNDAFGAGDNFSHQGFPNKDSDIYGNNISDYWDDAIESEGANKNVRIWGNYLGQGFVKIGTATTSIGPLYVFRNITGITKRTDSQHGEGGFIKTSSDSGGGRIFVFHNTLLQPPELGVSTAYGYGGSISNIYSRNNILDANKIIRNLDSQSSYDYDLYKNGTPPGTEQNGIRSVPSYANSNTLVNGKGDFSLSPNSPGYDDGQVLYNFNDNFTGSAPDMGAHESGTPAMEFGVIAFKGNLNANNRFGTCRRFDLSPNGF